MIINLVLSGGAARGAFHLGVLHFIEHNNIQINAYSGSSIGSIIAVSHASGISAKEQLKIFSSSHIKKTLKFNYFRKSLMRIDSDHTIFKELLPIDKLEDLQKTVYVNAYDTKRKQMHYFNQGNSHLLCMASCALIPLFKPVTYENMHLIDGGLIDNIPITPLQNSDEPLLSIDLIPRVQSNSLKRFSLLKPLKRRLFKRHIHNANSSRLQTDLYLTSPQLLHYKMFTFHGLEEMFKLGLHEAEHFFTHNFNCK